MKELYIECNMGVAGDMLSAALLDTLSDNDRKIITDRLNSLLPDVSVTLSKVKKNKISASKLDVSITECGHHHTDIRTVWLTVRCRVQEKVGGQRLTTASTFGYLLGGDLMNIEDERTKIMLLLLLLVLVCEDG